MYSLSRDRSVRPNWGQAASAALALGLTLVLSAFQIINMRKSATPERWAQIASASAWVDRSNREKPVLGALWNVRAAPPLGAKTFFLLELWTMGQKVTVVQLEFGGDPSLIRGAIAGSLLDPRTQKTSILPARTQAQLRNQTVELTMPLSGSLENVSGWRALTLSASSKGDEYPGAKKAPLALGDGRPEAQPLPIGALPPYMSLSGLRVSLRAGTIVIVLPDIEPPAEHKLLRSITFFDLPVTQTVNVVVETGASEHAFLDTIGPGTEPVEMSHEKDGIEIRVPVTKLGGLRHWYAISDDPLVGHALLGSIFNPRSIENG